MTPVEPKKKIESFQDLVVWQKIDGFGHRMLPTGATLAAE